MPNTQLYKVMFEIEVISDSPENAAKHAESLMQDMNRRWSYEVTDEAGNVEIVDFNDDLDE